MKKSRRWIGLGSILVMAMSLQPARSAGNEALQELLRALRDNGTIDEPTYRAIRRVADQGTDQDTDATRALVREEMDKRLEERPAEQAGGGGPEINTRGKFEVTSQDGDFKFRVGGRVQADAAAYSRDIADHGNGTEIRRGRLFASGTLWRAWDYKFQYDFTGTGAAGIADAYMAYNTPIGLRVQAGHFKEPFSLQNMTSSKYVNFIERGLPHLFVPGRNIGVELSSGETHWSAAAGIFGSGIGDPSSNSSLNDTDEGLGATARVTLAPVNREDQVIHLGGSLSFRNTDQDNLLRFSSRPESHITDVRLVDTMVMPNTEDFYRYALEAAWVYERLTLQGEYMGAGVSRSGNPDADFDGFYAEILWFLTDDRRSYSGSSGAFKSVKPQSVAGKGGWGAWQIGTRFSSIDLSDGGINGGEEDNLTLGLNWFPNANLRFSANYVKVLDMDGGPVPGDNPDIFTVRGQLEF